MVDELAWLVGWREPGGRSASQLETLHVDHVGSKLCRSRENERPMASPRWMAGAWRSILIPAQRQTHGRIALRAGYRVGAVWVVVGAVGMNPRSAVRGGR